MTELPFHARTTADALVALDSAAAGLSSDEARRRLERHGPNSLPVPPGRSLLARLAAQFNNVLIHVLLVAAVVTAILGHWLDTSVIVAVVVLNAVIGLVQEGKAEAAMGAIGRMLAPRASVLRDGHRVAVDGADLVPGDVVLLEAGDRVPADLRLLTARALAAQEAILTGESVPVEKSAEPVDAGVALGDRASMLWSGTMVTRGTGSGLVVATGTATEIGRIGGLMVSVGTLVTPLIAQIDRFGRGLSLAILAVAALLLAYGHFVNGQDLAELFMPVVAVAVSAIPEGLPAVLTITLAIGVQAMARRNAIVRRLPAIETVGAVSVICTDKTGTLTRNVMTVAVAVTPGGQVEVADTLAADDGLRTLALAGLLCNDARLVDEGDGWRTEGDPMEGALLAFARQAGVAVEGWQRVDAIPFDSRHRYMAVLNARDGERRVHVKGAPERILAMCAGDPAFDPGYWHERADRLAHSGHRVLALARARLKRLDKTDLDGGLEMLGLVGLIDPPRPEAVEAVAACRAAGINVKMITGDHAGTAAAIARQVGLEHADRVLTGNDLDALDDTALARVVREVDVYARTTPEDKLRLVEALQAHGLTVAMTGDGVNDAPALKRADVGIAMGRKGSEAAREAASMVLADDNFASIAAAVREGRTVYDNIRKAIAWTLPTSVGEAAVIIVAILLGIAAPLSALQVLWVNMITATTLGMALAFEPTEPATMARPPRPRNASILSGELVWSVGFVGAVFAVAIFAVFAWSAGRGDSLEQSQTLALNTLVALEVFYLFRIRYLHGTSLTLRGAMGTPAVWAAIGAVSVAQAVITYLPWMNMAFGTSPLSLADLAVVTGIGVAFMVLVEVEKRLRRVLVRR